MTQRVSQIEEIELCKRAQSGDQVALDKMVTHNLGLVQKIANKFYIKNEQYDISDLIQEGIFGLIKAINKFDVTQGCRFSTYAYYWIYCFVSRYNTNSIGKIRVPSHIREKIRKSDTEIDANEIKAKIPNVISLSLTVGEDSDIESLVGQYDDDTMIQYEIINEKMKEVLTPREIDVINYRYGLNGCQRLTHRECADIFNVTYATIFSVEKKAIRKLQAIYN